ncbi:MAG: phosphotransferase [Cyclobacteriaceae bacterium]
MAVKFSMDPEALLKAFGIHDKIHFCQPHGSGHIHLSYRITTDQNAYFLQAINTRIFTDHLKLESNTKLIAKVLKRYYGDSHSRYYLQFIPLVHDPLSIHHVDQDSVVWRLSYFVADSFSHDVVPDRAVAYNAAKAFADYILALSEIPQKSVYKTIPNFHNALARFQTFETIIKRNPLPERKSMAQNEIDFCNSRSFLAFKFQELINNKELKTRIVHHDTKLNNILFDRTTGDALCVIDLDTTMPGTVLSDFGDMVRTMCNLAAEDEPDLSKVVFNKEIFGQIAAGYLEVLKEELYPSEIESLVFGAKLFCWIQAIRFLGDYLQGDKYYTVNHALQNLHRTKTQIELLKQIELQEQDLQNMVQQFV